GPVAAGIAPEPAPGLHDRLHEAGRVDADGAPVGLAGVQPALVDATGVVEQRVVEVDEQRLHRPLTRPFPPSPAPPSPAPPPRVRAGRREPGRGGRPIGSCTSGRCAAPRSSRIPTPPRGSAPDPSGTPSSTAPRGGCARGPARGSPRPRDGA